MTRERDDLSELSLKELWELFPITLTEHKPEWDRWFDEEQQALGQILPADGTARIDHVGSTAIGTIWAKPIVDILVEMTPDGDRKVFRSLIEDAGYVCMSEHENRMSFNKGYTVTGFADRVFHLHLRKAGDHDELYFRDYMREHPEAAKEYEELKLKLWKIYEHDRDAYTEHKTDIVKRYTDEAKKIYGGRYAAVLREGGT